MLIVDFVSLLEWAMSPGDVGLIRTARQVLLILTVAGLAVWLDCVRMRSLPRDHDFPDVLWVKVPVKVW